MAHSVADEAGALDDLILFSRVSKRLALKFCQEWRPSNERIAEMLEEQSEVAAPGVDFSKLGRIRQNERQLRRTISNSLRTLYSLQQDEAEPIVDILVAGLLA